MNEATHSREGRAEAAVGQALPDLDVTEIQKIIPHRYPMLLIDRLVEALAFERAVGLKSVTVNEPFFQGHFPGRPVMPGVLLIECMAQTAGALVLHHLGDEHAGKLVFFMSIDKARFRKPVVPGDTVRFPVHLIQRRPPVWRYAAEAIVDGKKVAEAEIGAMLMNER
jgi:3-hydroxyacyl-[acyl-carrier-protein] dehydratase